MVTGTIIIMTAASIDRHAGRQKGNVMPAQAGIHATINTLFST
jgi:hypothetical protein